MNFVAAGSTTFSIVSGITFDQRDYNLNNGGVIEITDLNYDSLTEVPAGRFEIELYFVGDNQDSAKDAGGWKVTTYSKTDGDNTLYVVDKGEATTSFTA